MTKGGEGMPCTCILGLTCLESQGFSRRTLSFFLSCSLFLFRSIHAKAGEEENRRRKRNIPDAYSTFSHRCLRVASMETRATRRVRQQLEQNRTPHFEVKRKGYRREKGEGEIPKVGTVYPKSPRASRSLVFKKGKKKKRRVGQA